MPTWYGQLWACSILPGICPNRRTGCLALGLITWRNTWLPTVEKSLSAASNATTLAHELVVSRHTCSSFRREAFQLMNSRTTSLNTLEKNPSSNSNGLKYHMLSLLLGWIILSMINFSQLMIRHCNTITMWWTTISGCLVREGRLLMSSWTSIMQPFTFITLSSVFVASSLWRRMKKRKPAVLLGYWWSWRPEPWWRGGRSLRACPPWWEHNPPRTESQSGDEWSHFVRVMLIMYLTLESWVCMNLNTSNLFKKKSESGNMSTRSAVSEP